MRRLQVRSRYRTVTLVRARACPVWVAELRYRGGALEIQGCVYCKSVLRLCWWASNSHSQVRSSLLAPQGRVLLCNYC